MNTFAGGCKQRGSNAVCQTAAKFPRQQIGQSCKVSRLKKDLKTAIICNIQIAHGKRSRHNSCQRSMAGVLPFAVCGFHNSLRSRSDVCRSEHLCQVFVQCFQKALLVLLHHGHELGQLSSTKLLWDGDPRPERGPQPVHNLLVGVHAFTCNTHTNTHTSNSYVLA